MNTGLFKTKADQHKHAAKQLRIQAERREQLAADLLSSGTSTLCDKCFNDAGGFFRCLDCRVKLNQRRRKCLKEKA